MRLGLRQLELLRAVGTNSALVLSTARSRRLCQLGLMRPHGADGGFATVTPAGLRALVDAMDSGRIAPYAPPARESCAPASKATPQGEQPPAASARTDQADAREDRQK